MKTSNEEPDGCWTFIFGELCQDVLDHTAQPKQLNQMINLLNDYFDVETPGAARVIIRGCW